VRIAIGAGLLGDGARLSRRRRGRRWRGWRRGRGGGVLVGSRVGLMWKWWWLWCWDWRGLVVVLDDGVVVVVGVAGGVDYVVKWKRWNPGTEASG